MRQIFQTKGLLIQVYWQAVLQLLVITESIWMADMELLLLEGDGIPPEVVRLSALVAGRLVSVQPLSRIDR